MWLITVFGFFSIVEKPGQKGSPFLTIRARAKADLEQLRQHYLPDMGAIQTGEGTDYRYRVVAPRAALSEAFARAIRDIHYANFKSSVAANQGSDRAKFYHDLWTILMKIQIQESSLNPVLKHSVTAIKAHTLEQVPQLFSQSDEDLPANVSCGGVIFDERGRVLLRKPRGEFDGYVWTFPKGKREAGEPPQRAALRESREECGVEAAIVSRIPGLFKGGTGSNLYFVMKLMKDHRDFDPKETEEVQWAEVGDAATMIQETRNPIGRERDTAVLSAAVASYQDSQEVDLSIALDVETLTQWFAAIQDDDVSRVAAMLDEHGEQLLRAGQVLKDGKAQTSQHVAAHFGASRVLKHLLECGVDPNECIRDAATEPGFVTDFTEFPRFLRTPLDWAVDAGHETVVRLLLDWHASPDGATPVSAGIEGGFDGFPDPISCPLSRAVRLPHEKKGRSWRLQSIRMCRHLLNAGAKPNRLMTVSRWKGTPLAFAWRELGERDLCATLLSYGAELFTDDQSSISGAIVGGKFKTSLARFVIEGLPDINKRYRWGVPMAPYAICTGEWGNRREILQCFLHAGADPTLVFNHSLFGQSCPSWEAIAPHLDALAAILDIVEQPLQPWASGKTLEDAWRELGSSGGPRGAFLFDMAKDACIKHVGFDAISEAQQSLAFLLQLKENFQTSGAWGYVKHLGDKWPSAPYQGFSVVVQFQHDSADTVVLWLCECRDGVRENRLREHRLTVAETSEGRVLAAVSDLVAAADR